jgi:hypothetical protein
MMLFAGMNVAVFLVPPRTTLGTGFSRDHHARPNLSAYENELCKSLALPYIKQIRYANERLRNTRNFGRKGFYFRYLSRYSIYVP